MERRPPKDDYWHAIQAMGYEWFPDHYAGLGVVPGGVEVYRKPCEDFDRAARALADDHRISFRDVAHSARELQAVVDRLLDDHAYWLAQGVAVHGFGPRPELGVVEVTTSDPDAARRLLPLRYGNTPPILVVEGGPLVALGLSRGCPWPAPRRRP